MTPHVADGEAQFVAVCVAPDFCKVGKKIVPFDSYQILPPEKLDYAASVFARDEPVLTQDSLIRATCANAGKGVGSKVSRGRGHVKIVEGSATVYVESRPVARHGDLCWINCRLG